MIAQMALARALLLSLAPCAYLSRSRRLGSEAAPPSMLGRLPRHSGYEWQMAGTDLVLVQIGTAIVADVLRDVFR